MASLDRRVTLVDGYVRNADAPARGIRVPALWGRLAVAIWSFPEDAVDFYFDDELVVQLCRAIADGRPTQVRGINKRILILEDVAVYWRHATADEKDLFDEMLIFRDAVPAVQVRGLPYYHSGGPAPYRDSVTLEVFAPTTDLPVIRAVLRRAAVQAGAAVSTSEGLAEPDVSIRQRMNNVLRGRNPWVLVGLAILVGLLLALLEQLRK